MLIVFLDSFLTEERLILFSPMRLEFSLAIEKCDPESYIVNVVAQCRFVNAYRQT